MENQQIKQVYAQLGLNQGAVASIKAGQTLAIQEITLTQEEENSAIYAAKKAKYHDLERKAYLEKLKQEESYPEFTAEQMANFVRLRLQNKNKPLILDMDNEDVFKLLCYYFTGDNRFNEAGYDLNKGICLHGNIGCGKTFLMQSFMENQIGSYVVKRVSDVCGDYADYGEDEGINIYCNKYRPIGGLIGRTFGHKDLDICFDDLGTEDLTKHYGNSKNVMADIMYRRDAKGLRTHITMNLDDVELKEKYGSRIASRFNQMFNIVSFPETAKDRRL